jgi:DNA invertase Pin-like site-specific DNA recombinase
LLDGNSTLAACFIRSEQDKSGLVLEAQREALDKFAAAEGFTVADVFTEVASAKLGVDERTGLRDALAKAKKLKCAVIVSKLDRLSRDVAFISGLMARGIPFIVAELGVDVSLFVLHLYAALGEQERKMIGTRTKDALAALKTRGVVPGNRTNLSDAQAKGQAANAAKAASFNAQVLPKVKMLQAQGMTMAQIEEEFNADASAPRWANSGTSPLYPGC